MIGIDLFSGAGGMSLGAEMAGIDVRLAVEMDDKAAATYIANHPKTRMLNKDIREIESLGIARNGESLILFGGPPCQGFSSSNRRTRSKNNPQNWLYKEFLRIAEITSPNWVLFENVKGFRETESGFFEREVICELEKLGYTSVCMKLNACNYGVPQKRIRCFIVGSIEGYLLPVPEEDAGEVNVREAIGDLPHLENGASQDIMPYGSELCSDYARQLRLGLKECTGNLVTKNSDLVIQRYAHIPQGGNWEDIPNDLMENYTDKSRCHTGIYKRLSESEPSITVGNYRKSMIVHPWENRGLSVREAARLQSFPDTYVFKGSIGFQQQQVGNAVPPFLAERVFQEILQKERSME